MQKRVVLVIFLMLLIAVGIATSFFYITTDEQTDNKLNYIKENIAKKIENKGNYIMEHFSEKTQKVDSLPTTELVIQLDDNEKNYQDRSYLFYFDNLSEYDFFSVKQILSSSGIPHSFIKDDNQLRLNIVTNKKSVIEDVVKEFKSYKIDYKIKG
jgi:hypothetical protein